MQRYRIIMLYTKHDVGLFTTKTGCRGLGKEEEISAQEGWLQRTTSIVAVGGIFIG